MPRHILILSASVGAGHLRAAEAVEMATRTLGPNAVVKNVDVLKLSNTAFQKLYGKSYLDVVQHAPHLAGYLYDKLDKPRKAVHKPLERLKLLVEKANLRAFLKLLRDEPWDIIVNTHFLPAEIVASLKKKGELNVPQITVTTDFEAHRLWFNQPCERYCTAIEEGAAYLRAMGVSAKDIRVTGIPIHPLFAEDRDRNECLKAHGLKGKNPVVLQLAGGFGVGPIQDIYKAILSVETPLEVVVVSGRNEKLRKKLDAIPCPAHHSSKVMGFTTKIDELMAASDLLVSKPGGLTTSEALARGIAIAVVNPIPGQESRNSDFLLENGAAIKINQIPTLAYKLSELLKKPKRLASLKRNAKRLGKPKAAFQVASMALKGLK